MPIASLRSGHEEVSRTALLPLIGLALLAGLGHLESAIAITGGASRIHERSALIAPSDEASPKGFFSSGAAPRDLESGSGLRFRGARAEPEPRLSGPINPHTSDVFSYQLAQFQLPPSTGDGKPAALELPKRLTYQYVYGSESTLLYRRDRDLNKQVRDNSNVVAPNVNGVVIYRPTDWLETTLELIFEREVPIHEEREVTLPNGEVVRALRRRPTLLVDQAFVTFREFTAPFELSVGRRNYEDERRSLFDTSLDVVSATLRQGRFRAEFFAGREVWTDLDLAPKSQEAKDRINTYVAYAEWRGIEDLKVAGYAIYRNDWAQLEGKPRLYGVRALGTPSTRLNYWGEFAFVRGSDEANRKLTGYSWDVGATYRFENLPFNPNVTLGYAYGSGDSDPTSDRNREFRQSGLHSNERRFAGIPQFKVFGEVLDPDLTNIQILTIGLGLRPTPGFSIDLVYHRYRLNHLADSIRNSAITAQMAQVDTHLSKFVGEGLDLVLGFRSLFGIRRLGLDFRLGWFKPGKAFIRNEGDDVDPILRNADKGIAIVAKIWW
ncbi:MAG: alginate export family protein [Burkholderiales bacterium]